MQPPKYKISFRRAKHVYNFSQWLKETSPDIVICIDVICCLYANKARKKSGKTVYYFLVAAFFARPTIKKKNMQTMYNVRRLSSGHQ